MIQVDLRHEPLDSISSLQIKDDFKTTMLFGDSELVLSKDQMEYIHEHCDTHFKDSQDVVAFEKYVESLRPPGLDRAKEKHYDQVQRLAYDLVRYLRMNTAKGEHVNQGNWNTTYLIENMKPKDFEFVVAQLLKRIPIGQLRRMIDENFTGTSRDHLGAMPMPSESNPETIEKSKVDEYLKKYIPLYVGFGFAMGTVLTAGTFWFFN